jgi:hypothetical protein
MTPGGEGTPARAASHDTSRAGWIDCWVCAETIHDHTTGQCWADPFGHTVAAHHECLVLLGESDLHLPSATW